MKQSCGNPVKSGAHIWPDAIFLNEGSTSINSTFVLEEAGNRFGGEFIKNNKTDDSTAVAVIGRLIVPDNFIYVNCGENKTCVFGYGPVAAPVKIDDWQLRHLNKLPVNIE